MTMSSYFQFMKGRVLLGSREESEANARAIREYSFPNEKLKKEGSLASVTKRRGIPPTALSQIFTLIKDMTVVRDLENGDENLCIHVELEGTPEEILAEYRKIRRLVPSGIRISF